jgi:hypothetical protein
MSLNLSGDYAADDLGRLRLAPPICIKHIYGEPVPCQSGGLPCTIGSTVQLDHHAHSSFKGSLPLCMHARHPSSPTSIAQNAATVHHHTR